MEREKLIALVTAGQKGDPAALSSLFNAYYNDVYYFALKTVKNEDLACDITQETFITIIKSIGDLKEPAAFVTWMKQIAYNQCIHHCQESREITPEPDEDGHTVFDTVAEDRQDFIPGDALDQEDFRKTILSMLNSLSPEQRAATLLYYYDELSVRQIAEIQSVPEGTVKSRLSYARKAIKAAIVDYEKKNDVRLHSVGLFPLIVWLYAVSDEVVPLLYLTNAAGAIAAATGITLTVSEAAAGAAAGLGAATTQGGVTAGGSTVVAGGTAAAGSAGVGAGVAAAAPLAVKVAAFVAAAALTIGGVAAVITSGNDDPPAPSTESTVYQEPSVVPSTDPVTGPTTEPVTEPATDPTEEVTEPSDAPDTQPTTEPVHVHEYTTSVDTPPTCTVWGYTTYYCDCGERYTDWENMVEATGHSWSQEIIAPTAEAGGYTLHTCANCGKTYTSDPTDPLPGETVHEHSYTAVTTAPNCTEWGYVTYTCGCGESYVDQENMVRPLGHNWVVREVIEPTTEAGGYTLYQCERCGENATGNYTEKLPEETEPGIPEEPEEPEEPVEPALPEEPATAEAIVPAGCTYLAADGTVLSEGEAMPELSFGDRLVTADYTYTFSDYGDRHHGHWNPWGWAVSVNDSEQKEYGALLSQINGAPVTSLRYTYFNCTNMTAAPLIPDSVTDMGGIFWGCSSLLHAPVIPEQVRFLDYAFSDCVALSGEVEINANPDEYAACFSDTALEIILTGTSHMLEELAATAEDGNVTVE